MQSPRTTVIWQSNFYAGTVAFCDGLFFVVFSPVWKQAGFFVFWRGLLAVEFVVVGMDCTLGYILRTGLRTVTELPSDDIGFPLCNIPRTEEGTQHSLGKAKQRIGEELPAPRHPQTRIIPKKHRPNQLPPSTLRHPRPIPPVSQPEQTRVGLRTGREDGKPVASKAEGCPNFPGLPRPLPRRLESENPRWPGANSLFPDSAG